MNKPSIKNIRVHGVKFGKNVTIIEPVNLYSCNIGDDSFVGPFVEIQRNVKIGRRCRIQSHSFICEFVSIGDDCFISHGVMFINDPFIMNGPANGRKELWKKTKIGNNVSIGTNATILPVKIVGRVVIGAGSVVTKDIHKSGIYAGNPARFIRKLNKTYYIH